MMTKSSDCDVIQSHLFKPLLRDIVSSQHALVKLADAIDWKSFEDGLQVCFCADNGRPSCPVRLMVALHYLKYAGGMSDEAVLDEWLENPYWQYFTGGIYFEHDYPTDQSTMSRWRKKLAKSGAEKMLEESLKTGLCSGFIRKTEEYLQRGGDRDMIEAFRGRFFDLIHYLDRFLNNDGLLENLPGWLFIEWSQANSFVQDVNYPSNMTYAATLDAMARLYNCEAFARRAEKMRETIRQQSWNGQWFRDHGLRKPDGTLEIPEEDITETCQYYAFFFQTAVAEKYPELWHRLIHEFGPGRQERGLWKEIWPSNAFIGNYLRLELLSQAGRHEQLLEETKGYFGRMADATGTLWEHDRTKASCCHGFSSYINVLLDRAVHAPPRTDRH